MPMWMIIALLGIVIILYASILPRTPTRKAVPDDFLDSVGDTLQHFADEIEEENKELLQMVSDMKREHESRTSILMSRMEQLEKQSAAAQDRLHEAATLTAHREWSPANSHTLTSEPSQTAQPSTSTSPSASLAPEPAITAGELASVTPSRFASTVKARYRELFDMYDAGKSMEYIAKKLGKNKGEVQLIIGLAKQEEPTHGQP